MKFGFISQIKLAESNSASKDDWNPQSTHSIKIEIEVVSGNIYIYSYHSSFIYLIFSNTNEVFCVLCLFINKHTGFSVSKKTFWVS